MKNKIRAFIAIEFNDAVKDALIRVQDKLRASGADVAWTKPDNIHITLRFLESIDEADVPVVNAAMTQAVAGMRAFPIEIIELGAFPDILFPKIIWAGVARNADVLSKIVANLEPGLKPLKLKKEERPFAAHITLGRTRSFKGKDQLVAALEETNIPAGLTHSVARITLFKSELTPSGPIYSRLSEIPLA